MNENQENKELDLTELRQPPRWRKRRKKSVRDKLLVGIVFLVLIAAAAFVYSPFCTFGTVLISGNKSIPSEDILREGHIVEPVNIIRIVPQDTQALIKKDLRVASVKVERHWWPPSIVIQIEENAVVAYIYSNYGVLSIDKNAMVLSAQKSFARYDAPLITGVRGGDEYVGDYVNKDSIKQAAVFLASLDTTTADLVSEIRVGNSQNISMIMNNGLIVQLGDFSASDEKAKILKRMVKEIAEKNFAISEIDLTYNPPTMRLKQ